MDFPQNYRKSLTRLLMGLAFLGLLSLFNRSMVFGALSAIALAAMTFLAFDFAGVKSRLLYVIFTASFVFHVTVAWMILLWRHAMLTGMQAFHISLYAWFSAVIITVIYLLLLEAGGSRLFSCMIALAINAYPKLFFWQGTAASKMLVIFAVLAGLWLIIKTTRRFFSQIFIR